jgi:hypothetical protein
VRREPLAYCACFSVIRRSCLGREIGLITQIGNDTTSTVACEDRQYIRHYTPTVQERCSPSFFVTAGVPSAQYAEGVAIEQPSCQA